MYNRKRDAKIPAIKCKKHKHSSAEISSSSNDDDDNSTDIAFNIFIKDLINCPRRASSPCCMPASPSASKCEDSMYNIETELSSYNNKINCSSDEHVSSNASDATSTTNTDFSNKLFYGTLTNPLISVEEFCNLCILFQRRFRITDVAMNGMIHLMITILPKPNNIPSSFKKIKQECAKLKSENFYVNKVCRCCSDSMQTICSNSKCSLFEKRQRPSLFVTLPVEEQLSSVLKIHGCLILENLKNKFNDDITDIIDSNNYQKIRPNPDGSTLKINLIASCDGGRFKNSRLGSFWPFTAQIVELPSKLRSRNCNMLLMALYIGEKKPDFEIYLKELVNQLLFLKNIGFSCIISNQAYVVKVNIFVTIFDQPARAAFWNCKQFNGRFGCMDCIHPGSNLVSVPGLKPTFGRRWYSKNKRYIEKDRRFYELAWRKILDGGNDSYYGIKRKPNFARLCNPGDQNVIDIMHQLYEGVIKMIVSGVFSSKLGKDMTKNKWTIPRRFYSEIDETLSTIIWPTNFSRKVPRISDLANYKAIEYKNLFLYAFLPIGQNYFYEMGCSDVWHWFGILHKIIYHCCGNIFDPHVLRDLRELIDVWQATATEFLLPQKQTINMHLLEHLPKYLKIYGPLNNISMFGFESMLSMLAKLVTSANGSLQQIVSRFLEEKKCMLWSTTASSKYIKHLLNMWYPNFVRSSGDADVVLEKCILSQKETNLMSHTVLVNEELDIYVIKKLRLKFGFYLKCSGNPADSNSWIKFKENDIILYGFVSKIIQVGQQNLLFLYSATYLSENIFFDSIPPKNHRIKSLLLDGKYGNTIKKVKLSKSLLCVNVDNILGNCIVIEIDSRKFFISDVIHDFEHN